MLGCGVGEGGDVGKCEVRERCGSHTRDVQESEQESSKFFRSRIGLGVKFNVKSGVEIGAGITISLSYYCNVH